MPSSSTAMSAPVSCWMVLMTLPLGPMTSPILSIGISKLMIFGAVARDLGAGLGDGGVHDVEDLRGGLPWPAASAGGEHVGGDAVDLRVELQRGDELGRAGDLEVHVAERVLGAEDVGEGRVLALGVDEAHGDAGDRRLDRHAARPSATASSRRPTPSTWSRSTPAPRRRGAACRPNSSWLGHDRQQRPLGERAVADLAALRRTDAAGLAGGERREVVVVHVALAGRRASMRVEHLLHARHAERERR